jgi:glycerol-3-phosphate acyltransferase PlsY
MIFITIILAYLLGSIPFGLLLTKMAGLGDIRSIGSGNIGATNVLRTGKKWLAALTLLLDGGKGAVPILMAHVLLNDTNPDFIPLAGFAALIGHLFPVWLNFKGGKGVATAIGIITALAWPYGLGVMLTWMAVAALTRFSSLAALVSLGLVPFLGLSLQHNFCDCVLFFIIAALVFWKHAANIQRLINGTEPKIGAKDKAHEPTRTK